MIVRVISSPLESHPNSAFRFLSTPSTNSGHLPSLLYSSAVAPRLPLQKHPKSKKPFPANDRRNFANGANAGILEFVLFQARNESLVCPVSSLYLVLIV